MNKRIIALFLAVIMVVMLLPAGVLADNKKASVWDGLPFTEQIKTGKSFALVNNNQAFLSVGSDLKTLVLSNLPYMWKLVKTSMGNHLVSVSAPELMFDLENAFYNAGTSVALYVDTGHPCQCWKLTKHGNGFIITSNENPKWCVLSRERGFILGTVDMVTENDVWRIISDGGWAKSFVSPASAPFYRQSSAPEAFTPSPEFWADFDTHGITDEMIKSSRHYGDYCAQYLSVYPVLSGTDSTYDYFSVDFYSETQPDHTYWALVCWDMDRSEYMRQKGYTGSDSVGAYAGLQDVGSYNTGIMSMWETYFYKNDTLKKTLVPSCLYPSKQSTHFDNEGSGTSLVTPFDWHPKTWYRFVLRSWVKGNTTYVGTWVEDLSSGKVTLLAVYDTHLPNSALMGGMSQFLENFSGNSYGEYRQMKLKNYCLRSAQSKQWYYIDTVGMSIWADLGFNQGSYRYRVQNNAFVAETCGLGENVCKGLSSEDTSRILRVIPAGKKPDIGRYSTDPELKDIDPNYVAAPVVSLSVSSSSAKPKLTWKAVDGAEKYTVYRAESKNGTYTKMYTTAKTSYVNTNAKAGTLYYYKVKAVNADGMTSNYSNRVYIPSKCTAPVVTIKNDASSGNPKLSWESVPYATKYVIYRATSKNGTYSKMYTTSKLSYTNTNAKAGKTYYYKVKAISDYCKDSSYSTVHSITCDLARPVVKIALSSAKHPKLSWASISGASKYEIYRATSKSGTYTKMYTTTKTSYTNTSAKAGKTYYYKVKAICGASSSGNSAYSTVVSIKAK